MKMDFLVKMSKIGGGSVGNGPNVVKISFTTFWTFPDTSRTDFGHFDQKIHIFDSGGPPISLKIGFLVKNPKIGGGSVGNGPKCYFYPFWTDWNQSRHIPHTFSTFSHKILFLTHRGSLLAI